MTDHVSPSELAKLLSAVEGSGASDAFRHLLECGSCRERTALKLGEAIPPGATVPTGVSSEIPSQVSTVLPFSRSTSDPDPLEQWFARAAAACEEEHQQVETRLEDLLSQPESAWRWQARRQARNHFWTLGARLLEESRARSFEKPRQGERLARAALEVANRLDPAVYGERLILDLQARCWAVLANCLRLSGDLQGADRALRQGLERLEGCFDPFERAEFLSLLASVRRSQRRFDESLEALDEAGDLYEQIRETPRQARVLVKKGVLWLDRAEPERALPVFLQAAGLLDSGEDLRTELAIRHNLALCHAELGHYPEARRVFTEIQPLYRSFEDRWTRLRQRWLQGTLEAQGGRLQKAIDLLREVRTGYLESDRSFDGALVSLELAVLLARENKHAELKEIAHETAALFMAQGIHREAVIALAYFQQAAERERVTVEALRDLSVYLRKSRFQPDLPFVPPTG